MVEKIFHQLTGCAEFTIQGDTARFLNLAAKSGFGFWNFRREGEKMLVCCRAGEYKKLRPLARRCRVKLRCEKKWGAPFLLRRLWLRPGLVAGALCAMGLFLFLNSFVWNVRVSGAETYGDGPVLAAARSAGVYPGAGRSSFDPKLAAREIIGELEGLKWAAVNTNGCFIEVAVGEASPAPEFTGREGWSNMIASRAGTILSVEAELGRPEVKPGEAVEQGQLLISGLYEEQLDPWDPRAANPLRTIGPARGRVLAETHREFTVQVSAERKEQRLTGEKQVNRALEIFGVRIPLGLNTVPKEDFRLSHEDVPLKALGVELPVILRQEVYQFTEESRRTLDKAELEQAALLKLRELQKEALPEGSSVLKEELSWSFPEGMCILTDKCRCRENIGLIQEVLVK